MRILVQRVKNASVSIEGKSISSIGGGLLVLVGIEESDSTADIDYLTSKMLNLRIFDDNNSVMNRSIIDIDGNVLIVSQFTLYALTEKGNRPSYIRAAKPEISKNLYKQFCQTAAQKLGKSVSEGIFGADMQVSLINDGPVTIWLDSKNKKY